MRGAAFARRGTADHLGAVGDRLLGMEGAVLAGKSLADDFGVLVDENGHASTARVRLDAAVSGRYPEFSSASHRPRAASRRRHISKTSRAACRRPSESWRAGAPRFMDLTSSCRISSPSTSSAPMPQDATSPLGPRASPATSSCVPLFEWHKPGFRMSELAGLPRRSDILAHGEFHRRHLGIERGKIGRSRYAKSLK